MGLFSWFQRALFGDKWKEIISHGGGYPASAGVVVDRQSAMQNATFRAGLLRIVQDIGSLPFPTFQRTENGREKRREHRVYRLLNDRANPDLSATIFRERMQRDAYESGNGVAWIQRDRSFAAQALWPVDPCTVKVEFKQGSLWYCFTVNGKEKEARPYDVLHLLGPSHNGYWGRSIIEEGQECLSLAIATDRYAAKYFANGGLAAGYWSSDTDIKPDARKRLEDQLNQHFTGLENAHKEPVVPFLKYNQKGNSAEATQLIEQRKFNAEEMTRLLQIPPHIAGLLDKATFSNIEHQGLDYVAKTIRGLANRWEQECNVKLFTEEEKTQGYYCEMMLDDLMRADAKTRYEVLDKAIKAGFMSPKVAAEKENLPTIGVLDVPIYPLNMGTAEDAVAEVKADSDEKPADATPLRHDLAQRMSAKIRHAIERHRNDADLPTWFAEFLSSKEDVFRSGAQPVFAALRREDQVSEAWYRSLSDRLISEMTDAIMFDALDHYLQKLPEFIANSLEDA